MAVGTLISNLDDDDLVISRREIADESPSEALLMAISELDIDLTATETRLTDTIDPDAVDELFARADESVRLSAEIWDFPVVISADAVHVLDKSALE